MKVRLNVIEITAESYNEEQDMLNSFPEAIWIKLDENRTKFYIKRTYKEVESILTEKGHW